MMTFASASGEIRLERGPSLRLWAVVAGAAFVAAMVPGPVLAHSGPPPRPADLWSSWTFDPILLVALTTCAWLYYRGLARLWAPTQSDRGLPVWRAQCFAGGVAVLLVALVSPLDALGSALFAAHMVQHLLLIAVAAPLLVLGAPLAPILIALPVACRRSAVRRLRSPRLRATLMLVRRPAVAWGIATGALWLWHAPILYEAALRSPPVHAIEHLFLLATAYLFWVAVLAKERRVNTERVSSRLSSVVLCLLGMAAQGTVLGIALAFSRSPWYAAYVGTTATWRLSPLEDQQIAGLVMWIPAGAIYFSAALALIGRAIVVPASAPATGKGGNRGLERRSSERARLL